MTHDVRPSSGVYRYRLWKSDAGGNWRWQVFVGESPIAYGTAFFKVGARWAAAKVIRRHRTTGQALPDEWNEVGE